MAVSVAGELKIQRSLTLRTSALSGMPRVLGQGSRIRHLGRPQPGSVPQLGRWEASAPAVPKARWIPRKG
jgi:hypothetical protein